jgi:hypothetical protein
LNALVVGDRRVAVVAKVGCDRGVFRPLRRSRRGATPLAASVHHGRAHYGLQAAMRRIQSTIWLEQRCD